MATKVKPLPRFGKPGFTGLNCRPVCILPVLSKIFEKIIIVPECHMDDRKLVGAVLLFILQLLMSLTIVLLLPRLNVLGFLCLAPAWIKGNYHCTASIFQMNHHEMQRKLSELACVLGIPLPSCDQHMSQANWLSRHKLWDQGLGMLETTRGVHAGHAWGKGVWSNKHFTQSIQECGSGRIFLSKPDPTRECGVRTQPEPNMHIVFHVWTWHKPMQLSLCGVFLVWSLCIPCVWGGATCHNVSLQNPTNTRFLNFCLNPTRTLGDQWVLSCSVEIATL